MAQVNLDQVDHQEVLVVLESLEQPDSRVNKDLLDSLDRGVLWDSLDLLETLVVLEDRVSQDPPDQWVTLVHLVLMVAPVALERLVLGVRKETLDLKVCRVHRVNLDCPMFLVREDSLEQLEWVVSRDLLVRLETQEDKEQLDCLDQSVHLVIQAAKERQEPLVPLDSLETWDLEVLKVK